MGVIRESIFVKRGDQEVEVSSIEPRIVQFISDQNMMVLREKKTGNALNVSFTEEGLKFTTNALGKLVYYKNAVPAKLSDYIWGKENKERVKANDKIMPVGLSDDGLEMSDKVYVEHFVPRNRPTLRSQIAEYTWVDKAYRLLSLNTPSFEA